MNTQRKVTTFGPFDNHFGERDPLGLPATSFGGQGMLRLRDGNTLTPAVDPTAVGIAGGSIRGIGRAATAGTYPYLMVAGGQFQTVDENLNIGTAFGAVSSTNVGGWRPVSFVPLPVSATSGVPNTMVFTYDNVHYVNADSSSAVGVTGFHPAQGAWSAAIYNGRIYSTGGLAGQRNRVYYTPIGGYQPSDWTATGSGNFDLGDDRRPLEGTRPCDQQARILGVLRDGIYFHLDGMIWRLSRDPEIGSLTAVTRAEFHAACVLEDVMLGVGIDDTPAIFDGVTVNSTDPYQRAYPTQWCSTALTGRRGAVLLGQDWDANGVNGRAHVLTDGVWAPVELDTVRPAPDVGVVSETDGLGVLFSTGNSAGLWRLELPGENPALGTPATTILELPDIVDNAGTLSCHEVHIDGYVDYSDPSSTPVSTMSVGITPLHTVRHKASESQFTFSHANLMEGKSAFNGEGLIPFRITVPATGVVSQAATLRVRLYSMQKVAIRRVQVAYVVHPYGGD